ncbi:ATP-binding protein [Eubacteriaceae bacterium ES3]|nr:ATP-binding protein [Eubacteriaceae bacterium ES3]
MSSQKKLLLIITGILMAGLLLTGGIVYFVLTNALIQDANDKNSLISQNSAYTVSQFFKEIKGVVEVTSQLDMFKDTSEYGLMSDEYRGLPENAMVEQRMYFRTLLKQYPFLLLSGIQTADKSQAVLMEPYAFQQNADLEIYQEGYAYRDYYQKMVASNATAFSEIYTSTITLEKQMVVMTPVYDNDGNWITTLGVAISLTEMIAQLENQSFGITGITYLVTDKGVAIAYPYLNEEEELAFDTEFVDQLGQIAGARESSIIKDPVTGKKIILNVTQEDVTGWYIVTQQEVSEALGLRNQILLYIGIAFVFIFILQLFLLRMIIAESVIKPLSTLSAATWKIAKGDYDVELKSKSLFIEHDYLANDFKVMVDKVRERENELQQFAYVASHDLQEPLRMVTSYLQILEKSMGDRLTDKEKKYMFYAVDGSNRMKQLIQDLLIYSRLANDYYLDESVDLNRVIENVMKNMRMVIKEEDVTIEFADLPTIKGNAVRLEQLFLNLISNAVKYRSEKPPHIRIWSEEKDTTIDIMVQDNGIGIEPEYLETVFQVFKRLHSRGEYEGTGIGLAICKKIANKHQATIQAESDGINGTIIHLSFKNKEN